MFIQIVPTHENSKFSIQDIIDSLDDNIDPEYNFIAFMITLGAKLKWQENRKTDIPQLLKDDLKKYGKYVKNKKIVEDEDYAKIWLKNFLNDDPFLHNKIDEQYKKYVDSYRLVGNPDDIDGPTIFVNDREINALKSFPKFMKNRNGSKIFTYNQQTYEWYWYNFNQYKEQFKKFKKLYKNKKVVINEENNNQHELNCHIWYSIAIQPIDDEGEIVKELICYGSLQVFKHFISGFVFYFRNKTDRDNAYNYLTN